MKGRIISSQTSQALVIVLLAFALFILGCSPDKSKPVEKPNLEPLDIEQIEKVKPIFDDNAEGFGDDAEEIQVSQPHSLTGDWMVYSKAVYYDDGEFAFPETPASVLQINDNGTWEFGNNSGKWEVTTITEDDWKAWGISQYGPSKKIVFYGWNGDIASGPLEGEEVAQFIWVIYRTGPPYEKAAGQVQMKFGWV